MQSGVTQLTETGCICENGTEYPLDILICATGFDTSYRPRFPIIGPGGINLQDKMTTEVKSYLGIAAPSFPNYCMFLGPFSPVGAGSVIPMIGESSSTAQICKSKNKRKKAHLTNPHLTFPHPETQADHILQLLDRYQTEPIHSFHPSPAAVSDFIAHTKSFMPRTVWSQSCRSPFKTPASNNVPTLWPGSPLHYMEAMRELRADDWEIRYRGNRFGFLGNGLSQAEFDPGCDLAFYVRGEDARPEGSRRCRRERVQRSGSQRTRELFVTCRREPGEIVLEGEEGEGGVGGGGQGVGDAAVGGGGWKGGVDGLWDGRVRWAVLVAGAFSVGLFVTRGVRS